MSGLVSEYHRDLTLRLHNSTNFQPIFTNKVSKSNLRFLYPTRYNLLTYLNSEQSYFFPNLFSFLGHPVLSSGHDGLDY